jgi:hypothetical protein
MIDNKYNKDLSFNSYQQYINNNTLYEDPIKIAQYNNFFTENDNHNMDIKKSRYMLNYLNSNKLEDIDNSLNDTRQIDINNYYTAKYNKESNILKQIIFYCCLALVGSLFFLKGYISEQLYIIYLAIIIFIGFSAIIYSLYNLYMRDSIVFDEYDYPYLKAPGTDMSDNSVEIKNNVDTVDPNKCL